MRKKALPVLGGEFRVFGELAFDHEFFDVVNGVDVGHAVCDYAADFFETFVGAHGADGVALDQDVSGGEKLEGFECGAVGAEDALAAFDESLFVAGKIANFNNVGCDAIVEDLDGLRGGDAAGEELDEVASVEDGGWIVGFASSFDRHAAFDEVQSARYPMLRESTGDERPGFFEVEFTIFGEEGSEGGFFGEGTSGIVGGGKGIDLSMESKG